MERMVDLKEVISNTGYELLKNAATKLPRDVKAALSKAYREESNDTGKAQLKAILGTLIRL